jgi:hypothetical protein
MRGKVLEGKGSYDYFIRVGQILCLLYKMEVILHGHHYESKHG